MKLLHLTVTEDDIVKGVPGSPNYCAVTRCVSRVFPKYFITTGFDRIHLKRDDRLLRIALSDDVRKWIAIFDKNRGLDAKPITFTIAVPDDVEYVSPGTTPSNSV